DHIVRTARHEFIAHGAFDDIIRRRENVAEIDFFGVVTQAVERREFSHDFSFGYPNRYSKMSRHRALIVSAQRVLQWPTERSAHEPRLSKVVAIFAIQQRPEYSGRARYRR